MTKTSTTEFERVARPGEIILDMECGYPGIVIGKAYVIDNPDFDSREELQDMANTQGRKTVSLEDAITRVSGYYADKLDKAPNMPIENNDEFEDMLAVEQATFMGASQKLLKAQQADLKPSELVVYDYFAEREKELTDRIKAIQDKITLFKSQLEGADAEERDTLSSQIKTFEQPLTISKQALKFSQHQKCLLLGILTGHPITSLESTPDGDIPVAESFPVGDMVSIRQEDGLGIRLHGLICYGAQNTQNDHTAIMAKAARATLAQTSKAAAARITHRDKIIIDGANKKIIVNPANETLKEMEAALDRHKERNRILTERSQNVRWPQSADGQQIKISSNIGYVDDMKAVNAVNAPAVGLYRTEVASLTRATAPSLEKWEELFGKVADLSVAEKTGKPKAITVRTADFEGDKASTLSRDEQTALIKKQLEALHKVSTSNPNAKLHVMFPQINDPEEYKTYKNWAQEAADKTGAPLLNCGSMIETAGAVDILEDILPEVDFISVGTNDLIASIQGYNRYDRDDMQRKYDPTAKAVVLNLKRIIEKSGDTPVSVCGDLASDPKYFGLLIGLGYRHLSGAVGMVPVMKEMAARIDTRAATQMAEQIFKTPDRAAREQILAQFNKEHLGLENGTLSLNWNGPAAPDTPPQLEA